MSLETMVRRLGGAKEMDATAVRAWRGGEVDRRGFLAASAAGGGLVFTIAVVPAQAAESAAPAAKPPANPNAFIKINPDNTVEIRVNRLDFGQGALTSLPMLVAEEMDLDWSQVRASLAPAGEAYKDPLFGIQMTGGSTAVAHSWQQHREIGAAARAMLVAAAAQQWKVDASSVRTEKGFAISGSRKASYASLAEAAARQPVPQKVTLKDSKDFRIIGKGQRRLDAVAAASGKKNYGVDMRLPGMKTAVLMRAPTFGGQVESFDASAAKAVPGVLEVLQVPTDRGGTGLAVIATGYWSAKQGRDALKVQWKPGASAGLSSDKLFEQFKAEAKAPKLTAREAGPAITVMPSKTIEAVYEVPYLAHAPMEPLNATFDLSDAKATVWAGTQFQTIDQMAIAQTLGLAPEQVTLNTLPAGGGFGRRAVPSSDYLREGAQIAKAWREKKGAGPLRVMWSREDDIKGGYYRPMHVHSAKIGLDGNGNVIQWDHAIVGQSILKGSPFEQFMVKDGIDATMTEGVVENTYGVPLRVSVSHPDVAVPVLWWRSVGHTHTAFVMETLADEVARAAGQDPVAWRLARYDAKTHARHIAALKLAVEKSGYGKRQLPSGQAFGVAVHESFGSVVAYVAEVSIKDGRPFVHRVTAGVHANTVVNPTAAEAQIQGGATYGFGMTLPGAQITLKDGQVEQTQFSDYTPPRITDAFPVAVHFVPSNDPPTGLGEPGTPVIVPAVANAVAALTGKRLRKLPFETLT